MRSVLRRFAWTAAAIAVGALPVLGASRRGDRPDRCAWDGVRIDACYRARAVDPEGREARFCCVACLRRSIERSGRAPAAVRLTDEATGREIDAGSAWIVRSVVATDEATGNRLHVFAAETDARAHAAAFRGRLVAGPGARAAPGVHAPGGSP